MGFLDKMKGAAEKAQAAMPVGASGAQIGQANLAMKLRDSGVEHPGHINAMTATGNVDATNSKEYDIAVTISPSGGAAYDANIRQSVHPSVADRFVEGADVVVRVDPADPNAAMLWG